jgi:hypothetical protein
VRVDPDKKWISGKNTVRFKMLKDDTRIQLDLFATSRSIASSRERRELKYTRELNTVSSTFRRRCAPAALLDRFPLLGPAAGDRPLRCARLQEGSDGRHWINTANEGVGSAVWWPSKDSVARRARGHGHSRVDPE